MSKKNKDIYTFEQVLSATDYGVIIDGETGALRGLFIPEGSEDDDVPETIVNVCRDYFGIDPNEKVIYH